MRRWICVFVVLVILTVLASLSVGTVDARPLMDTYTSQPNGTTGIDSSILSNSPTTNQGTDTLLRSGESNGGAVTRRTLVKFDMSSIPSSATITSATLSLWVQADLSDVNRPYQVYRVLRNWVESEVTWNIFSTGNNWGTAGMDSTNDYFATSLASTTISGTTALDTEIQWTLDTTEVKKMIDGTYNNYGWLIKANTENNDGWNFYSSDNAASTMRPKLVIVYTPATSTPTLTLTPSNTPTNTATFTLTFTPSNTPTDTATNTITLTPSNTPTDTPTNTATFTPSNTPTDTATFTLTFTPSNTPTDTATNTITLTPSDTPTDTPTDTGTPTSTPSETLTPTLALSSTPTVVTTAVLIASLITYGKVARFSALLGLCGVVVIIGSTILIVLLVRRKKGLK